MTSGMSRAARMPKERMVRSTGSPALVDGDALAPHHARAPGARRRARRSAASPGRGPPRPRRPPRRGRVGPPRGRSSTRALARSGHGHVRRTASRRGPRGRVEHGPRREHLGPPRAAQSGETGGPTTSTSSTSTPGQHARTPAASAARSAEPVRATRPARCRCRRRGAPAARGGRLGPRRTTSSRRHRTRTTCPRSTSASSRARRAPGCGACPRRRRRWPAARPAAWPGRHQLASGST